MTLHFSWHANDFACKRALTRPHLRFIRCESLNYNISNGNISITRHCSATDCLYIDKVSPSSLQ